MDNETGGPYLTPQMRKALALREQGKSYLEIAIDMDVSKSRVGHLMKEIKHRVKVGFKLPEWNPLDDLGTRARRTLEELFGESASKSRVAHALQDGSLWNHHGVGKKTLNEIKDWVTSK